MQQPTILSSRVNSATTVQHHAVPHTTVQQSARSGVKSATTVEAATGNFGGGKWIAHCSLVCVLLWCYLTQPWLTFTFGMGIFLGEPVKKHLLQFYFYPYIDDYDPTTPILYNDVHTYMTEFCSTVKKCTGPKKEINAQPQDNFVLSIPKRKIKKRLFWLYKVLTQLGLSFFTGGQGLDLKRINFPVTSINIFVFEPTG